MNESFNSVRLVENPEIITLSLSKIVCSGAIVILTVLSSSKVNIESLNS